MVTCDTFGLEVEHDGSDKRPEIKYLFWTDRPAGTIVILECTRSYEDFEGREQLWTLLSQKRIAEPNALGDLNGGGGAIDIVEGDRRARAEFDQMGAMSAGIKTKISDEVTVSLSVGARQRLKAFGKANRSLSGEMVHESGGIHIVSAEARVRIELRRDLSPTTDAGRD